MDAGVQFVKEKVIELVAENPATPSKVAAVVAGACALLPVPLQVPEIVKLFESPFTTFVAAALCKGKDRVEVTVPEGAAASPPPPPHPESPTSSKDITEN